MFSKQGRLSSHWDGLSVCYPPPFEVGTYSQESLSRFDTLRFSARLSHMQLLYSHTDWVLLALWWGHVSSFRSNGMVVSCCSHRKCRLRWIHTLYAAARTITTIMDSFCDLQQLADALRCLPWFHIALWRCPKTLYNYATCQIVHIEGASDISGLTFGSKEPSWALEHCWIS